MAEKTIPNNPQDKNVVSREITRNPEYYVSPLVDIFENEDSLNVVADLPGVTKEGLNVKVEDHILTIEGKITHEFIKNPIMTEFEPISFFRQFELSEVINQEKITAELKHGVLTVKLPKAEKEKPRKIAITVS